MHTSTANICSAPTRSTEGHELGKKHTAKPNQRSIKLTSRNSNGTQPQEVHEQIYLPRETLMGLLKFSRARSPRFPPNFNKMSPNCPTDLLEQLRCSCCSQILLNIPNTSRCGKNCMLPYFVAHSTKDPFSRSCFSGTRASSATLASHFVCLRLNQILRIPILLRNCKGVSAAMEDLTADSVRLVPMH